MAVGVQNSLASRSILGSFKRQVNLESIRPTRFRPSLSTPHLINAALSQFYHPLSFFDPYPPITTSPPHSPSRSSSLDCPGHSSFHPDHSLLNYSPHSRSPQPGSSNSSQARSTHSSPLSSLLPSLSDSLHSSLLPNLTLYPQPSTPILNPPHPSTRPPLQKKSFFVFNHGASGIPKNSTSNHHSKLPEQSSSQLRSVQVGEDSYFLRTDSLGVADGVGGWTGKPGANAGLFSSKLMHHCSIELSRYEDIDDVSFLSYNQTDPVDVLQQAYERSMQESKLEGLLGSTTALVAVLRDNELRIANIGDCCCSIIRGNDFIFRSEEQQHSFNYPVQIGTNSKSSPVKDAQRYKIKVQKDDIVILSSDGLADNLFDEDILEEVLRLTSPSSSPPSSLSTSLPTSKSAPQLVSDSLCLRARTVIEDQQAVTSPFAQRANLEGIHYVGGKNDDISVLVAIVGDQSAP